MSGSESWCLAAQGWRLGAHASCRQRWSQSSRRSSSSSLEGEQGGCWRIAGGTAGLALPGCRHLLARFASCWRDSPLTPQNFGPPRREEDVACAEEPPRHTADASTQVCEAELVPALSPRSPSSASAGGQARLHHLRPPPPLSRHLAGLAQLQSPSQLPRTSSGFAARGSGWARAALPLGRTVSEGAALHSVVFMDSPLPSRLASADQELEDGGGSSDGSSSGSGGSEGEPRTCDAAVQTVRRW